MEVAARWWEWGTGPELQPGSKARTSAVRSRTEQGLWCIDRQITIELCLGATQDIVHVAHTRAFPLWYNKSMG